MENKYKTKNFNDDDPINPFHNYFMNEIVIGIR